jgi:malate/lactate dehydrogenase
VNLVVILGAGELGGALARQIAAADIAARVVLVDDAGRVAEGKALDIRQAAPVDGYSTDVVGSADEAAVVTADAIVIADRFASGTEWLQDAGAALIRRATHLNRAAMVICAGAHQGELVERSVREAGIDPRRLVGSAPEALRSAVMALTALEAGGVPTEISLTVIGRPPRDIIVPWENAAIGGRRASDALSPPAITRLDGRLAKLWPPGPYALAAAATRFLHAASTRSPVTLCAFAVAAGTPDRVGMLPVTMNASGIAAVLSPALTARDQVRLETALRR